jgi:hypothetical protein
MTDDHGASGRFRTFHRSSEVRLNSPLEPDVLRWQIQDGLRPPPDGYQLKAQISGAIRVGGEPPRSYMNGTIRGDHFVLRRYDNREWRYADLVRPKISGSIQPTEPGSAVRYRVKARPWLWLVPLGAVALGVIALSAGLYAMTHSHTDGPRTAIYAGLGFLASGVIGFFALYQASKDAFDPLETWLRERCVPLGVNVPQEALKPAWHPDPESAGWRWWTGFSWGAYADSPIAEISPDG